jgi:hypothetical protein
LGGAGNLNEHKTATHTGSGIAYVMAILEQQLARLDAIGYRIAAAHLDAAIQQLRNDIAGEITRSGPLYEDIVLPAEDLNGQVSNTE